MKIQADLVGGADAATAVSNGESSGRNDSAKLLGAGERSQPGLEWKRKRAHMLPGLIPFIVCFVYHEDPLPLWNIAVVAGAVGALALIAILVAGDLQRGEAENWRRTCLTYAAPPVAALLVFPARAEFAGVIVCVLAFGDSAAALGGRLYGHRPLPWNRDKTWVGFLCFILLAVPAASLIYWGEANPAVTAAQAAICGIAAGVPAAFAESLRSRVDDNLRISVAALVGVAIAGGIVAPGGA